MINFIMIDIKYKSTIHFLAPSSPPRDLTVVSSEDDPSQINLHWQPPKQPNGHITGIMNQKY